MEASLRSLFIAGTLALGPLLWTAAARADFPLPPPLTGNLYVSSYGTDEVFCYSASGAYLFRFAHEDLDGPRGLAFDPNGELYVASQHSDRILVFGEGGDFRRQFSTPFLDAPTSLAFAPGGKLYVSSFNTDEVCVFEDDEFSAAFTAQGLNGPNCIAFSRSGKIFVASQLDSRVYRFDAEHRFETRFTGGGLSSAMGIAIFSDRLYVTGGSSHTVAVFDLEGGFIENLATAPPVSAPQGIAFDENGRFITASFASGKVAAFARDGEVLGEFEEAGIRIARSVAFQPLPLEVAAVARGDFNRDGELNISDAVALLDYLFGGRQEPSDCPGAGDANDDGRLDLGDAVFLLNFLFSGHPGPDGVSGCGA